MATIKAVYDCFISPRLIKIFGNGPVERYYEPNTLESWGDKVIHSLYVMFNISVYTSPLLAGILYQRGYFVPDGLLTLSKFVTSIGVILVVSFCFRSIGRSQNATYMKFLETLNESKRSLSKSVKQQLNMYDFEFYAWPIEFNWKDYNSGSSSSLGVAVTQPSSHQDIIQYFINIPIRIIAFVAIRTFGIKLIYPGSISLLQKVIEQSMYQGRTRLVELNRGERFKLLTGDNNEIDSMFVDRRNITPNGNTLVVCCEGNAGFYEIGIMITPVESGFSVLGWNHPGFGGSTGQPYPPQEQNAIDTVMQFAIHKLGFKVENILIFGWSIGGYTATYAAMKYPEIKGLVLDATFDDILPLALNQMPLDRIVNVAIREHVNLHISEQLNKYPGPTLLIRRTEDEVICLREGDLSSNRGNHLLLSLLRHRYPCLMEESQTRLLKEYLAHTGNVQEELLEKFNINESMCYSLLQSYISEFSKSYPMKIGDSYSEEDKNQMVLYLARKYLKDFKSTHCINLPTELFQIPWDVAVESDFVFT